jgi:hypothetical protein
MQHPLPPRFYWPPNDKVKAWLVPNWDAWVSAPPPWFTPRFVKYVTATAPPEVLPLTVLRQLAARYSNKGQGGGHEQTGRADDSEYDEYQPETEAGGAPDLDGITTSNSNRRLSHGNKEISREGLVRIEIERRASKAFARAKQLWIWVAALVFSYVDFVTTVVVGLQYVGLGTAQGTRAAHVTFGMLAGSLGIQTLLTHLSGTYLCACT